MPPEQQTPTEQTPQPSQNVPTNGNSKKIIAGASAGGLIIALLLGTVIYLLLSGDDRSGNTANDSQSNSQNAEREDVAVDQGKVVAKLASTDPDIDVELVQPRKVGNTLVVNYNLVSKKDDNYVTGYKAGVYNIQFGTNPASRNQSGTAEPYAVSDGDGQKYGLARDDKNQPLASRNVDARLDVGDKITGYVTLTLPPSGSTVSVFLGDMSAFSGIKITY